MMGLPAHLSVGGCFRERVPANDSRYPLRDLWRVAALSFCLLLIAASAWAAEQPTAAVVPVAPSDLTVLLEAKLLELDSVTWLDRGDVDRVLKEQELQNLLSGAWQVDWVENSY